MYEMSECIHGNETLLCIVCGPALKTVQAPTLFTLDLDDVLREIRTLLVDKNRKYGDSALSPVRVFSKASAVEQINVRLDDKLSRLMSGQLDDTEDVLTDMLGYLILLRIAEARSNKND
jgi:hypothetical protein